MAGPWIKFAEVDLKDGRKTKVWAVMTLDGTYCLELIAQWCKAKTKEHKEWQRQQRPDPTATISPKAPSGDTANRS